MSSAPQVERFADAGTLAAATADRTVAALTSALARRTTAHLVVTGGGILEAVLEALADPVRREAVDWRQVHVWWGDERFVPARSDDRNDLPARAELFDHVEATLHPMPASDGPHGEDIDAAAAAYAAELAAAAPPAAGAVAVPQFDVALIGLGPDGHCCSLFPDQPGPLVRDASVIAVRDSPKPPPLRLSLTFPSLDAVDQLWFIASGDGKAQAVAAALGGADPAHVPSAGPRGRTATVWLIDQDAAARLPAQTFNA